MRDLESRATAPSSTGKQLDGLRNGTIGTSNSDASKYDAQAQMTAGRLLVWNSISKLAQRALVIKNTPIEWENGYRLVKEEELSVNMYWDPPIYMTAHGEEPAPEEEARTPPPEGYRIVRSPRPIFARNDLVADYLGVSPRKLRTLLERAYYQIENHPLFKLF